MTTSDPKRELLRHTLATLAYRGGKTVRNAPVGFADFAGAGRTPGQILAHIGDLLDWALSMANGTRQWHDSTPLPWDKEAERFFAALKSFDDFLASSEPLQAPAEKLFQGSPMRSPTLASLPCCGAWRVVLSWARIILSPISLQGA